MQLPQPRPIHNLAAFATLIFFVLASPVLSQDVPTYHNSNARTGVNSKETALTLSNVNSAQFGKLFTVPADGLVDAEPLYISAVTISGIVHNVLIIASEHGTVYAYDADTGSKIWHITTLKSGETTSDDRGCGQVTPEIGVTSTPVVFRPKNRPQVALRAKALMSWLSLKWRSDVLR